MKVLLVVGSYPPSLCGVGDYTARLSERLNPIRVTLVASGREGLSAPANRVRIRREMGGWRFGDLRRFLGILDEERPDLVHFQYPSRDFGWKLLPVFLPLILAVLRPRQVQVCTIHEFAGIHPLRKIGYLFLTLFSRAVVTPSAEVRRGLSSFYPFGSVEIGSEGEFSRREEHIT